MILLDNHILFASADELQTICRPLHSVHPKLGFTYCKFYHNKKHTKLTLQPAIQKRIYEENYIYDGIMFYCDHLLSLNTGVYNNEELIPAKYNTILRNVFKVDPNNILTIVVKSSCYHELFYFPIHSLVLTDTTGLSYSHFFLQHMPLFKRFCLYFKDRAKNLIRHAEKQQITLHREGQLTTNVSLSLHQLCQNTWKINYKNFLKDTSFRRMQLEDPTVANLTLSGREFECAIALLRNGALAQAGPNTALTTLYIGSNKISAVGAEQICKVLPYTNIELFSLTSSSLPDSNLVGCTTSAATVPILAYSFHLLMRSYRLTMRYLRTVYDSVMTPFVESRDKNTVLANSVSVDDIFAAQTGAFATDGSDGTNLLSVSANMTVGTFDEAPLAITAGDSPLQLADQPHKLPPLSFLVNSAIICALTLIGAAARPVCAATSGFFGSFFSRDTQQLSTKSIPVITA